MFQLARNPNTGKWKFKTIHVFCRQLHCTDGQLPVGTLVVDTRGNLYGVAAYGGRSLGAGLVYELSPGHGNKWRYRILYALCQKRSCLDGELPYSGLTWLGQASGQPYDGKSPLYGTTLLGGVHSQGVAFEVTPGRGRGAWTEQVIYDFCSLNGCADGAAPFLGLLMDSSGSIYGVTESQEGGSAGVVFELSSPGGTWNENVLYTFCQQANCADGEGPNPLAMDSGGNLFGTAYEGGANDKGVLFELKRNGSSFNYSVLYSFCSQANCADGSASYAQVSIDASGNLVGTTAFGGGNNTDENGVGGGTIFRWSSGGLSVLYSFCAQSACSDGEYPVTGVLPDSSGDLFGTTEQGGKYSPVGGTMFELTR